MRDASAAIARQERLLGRLMAVEDGGLPRQRYVPVGLCVTVTLGRGTSRPRRPAHDSSSTVTGADSGASRFFTCIQISAATWSLVRFALMSTQRCGSSL